MNISSISQQSLYSLRQAIGMANMQRALNQDALSVASITESMKNVTNSNAAALRRSVNPHIGGNIDLKV